MSEPWQRLLSRHDIKIPNEDDILQELDLTWEEFCERHGFDPSTPDGIAAAQRQMTMHLLNYIITRIVAKQIDPGLASATAARAILKIDPHMPADDPQQGWARGLEHSDEDVRIFLDFNNAHTQRLRQAPPHRQVQPLSEREQPAGSALRQRQIPRMTAPSKERTTGYNTPDYRSFVRKRIRTAEHLEPSELTKANSSEDGESSSEEQTVRQTTGASSNDVDTRMLDQ